MGILLTGKWYSFLYELGQVWVATSSVYIAATGVVSLGNNSSRILVGMSTGTLYVCFPFLRPLYTIWLGKDGCQHSVENILGVLS